MPAPACLDIRVLLDGGSLDVYISHQCPRVASALCPSLTHGTIKPMVHLPPLSVQVIFILDLGPFHPSDPLDTFHRASMQANLEGQGHDQQPHQGPTAIAQTSRAAGAAYSFEPASETTSPATASIPPSPAVTRLPQPQDCLGGVTSAVSAARAAREALHSTKLAGLRLQAEAHGASVQERLARGVTHILVYPPGKCERGGWRATGMQGVPRGSVVLMGNLSPAYHESTGMRAGLGPCLCV
jgi:hypothetical protein